MDKQTLSNYGWVVICTLVLAVMIALATPFGKFIANGVQSTLDGLYETAEKALAVAGIYVDIDHDGIYGDDEENTPLDAPNLQYINGKLIISGSDGAEEFVIYVDGNEIGTINYREIALSDNGFDVGATYTIDVVAKSSSRADSERVSIDVTVEQAQDIKLNAPTLSVRDGSYVTGDVVSFADNYSLYINGEHYSDIPADVLQDVDFTEILPNGTYEVYVIANAPGYVSSDMSNVITVEITNGEDAGSTELAAPYVSIIDGLISFDEIAGAVEYDIYVDGELLGSDFYRNINGIDLSDAGFDDGRHTFYIVPVDENGNRGPASNTVTFAVGEVGELTLSAPVVSIVDGNVRMELDSFATMLYLNVNGNDFGLMPIEEMGNPFEVPVEMWLNDAGVLQIGENTIVVCVTDETGDIMSEMTTYTFTVLNSNGDVEGGNQGGEPEGPAPEITLSAPVITFNGTVCTFEEVEGAIEYDVYTNGELLGTTDHYELNGLDFAELGLDAGDYEIYIVARDSEGGISEMSNVVLITIA